MIIGECPYCGFGFMLPCPDKCPAYGKETCEDCGKEFWERYSRIDPCAYTLEEFAERFNVDETTKTITAKGTLPNIDHEALRHALFGVVEKLYVEGSGTDEPRGIIRAAVADAKVSTNPANRMCDYLLDPLNGLGVDATEFDEAQIKASANYCDEPAAQDGGGPESAPSKP